MRQNKPTKNSYGKEKPINIINPTGDNDQKPSIEPSVIDKNKLDNCLTTIYKNFIEEWNQNCKTSGLNTHLANCNLPASQSETIKQHWEDAKRKCYK